MGFHTCSFSLLLQIKCSFGDVCGVILAICTRRVRVRRQDRYLFSRVTLILARGSLIGGGTNRLFTSNTERGSHHSQKVSATQGTRGGLFISSFFTGTLCNVIGGTIRLPITIATTGVVRGVIGGFGSRLHIDCLKIRLRTMCFLFFIFVDYCQTNFHFYNCFGA